jgi:hypothetical protein
VRLLRIFIGALALVLFWASAEHGAFTDVVSSEGPAAVAPEETAPGSINTWDKLRNLFVPQSDETVAAH